MFRRLWRWSGIFNKQVLLLFYAWRHPATPGWIKLLSAGLAAYLFSPVDLIPDVIPFVGLLDDAAIVPGGIALLVKLLPTEVRLAGEARVKGNSHALTVLLIVCLLLWLILTLHYFWQ